jgi:non-ribosomal peptide synthetase component E (peptide arylation enzyme)
VLSEHKLPRRCEVWPTLPKSPLGKILKSQIHPRASATPSPNP